MPGGFRPGAGRKTDQQRAQKRADAARSLSKIEAIAEQYEEAVWQQICEKAAEGNRDAQKLFADHAWGRPGQKQSDRLDPVVTLWCSFRGVPYTCMRCEREDLERKAAVDQEKMEALDDPGTGP